MNNNCKKNIAIVTGVSVNWAFALANVLMQLKQKTPRLLQEVNEIIVYHDGISESDINLLNKIQPCTFIKYEFPVNDISRFNPIEFFKYTSLTFARLECFNLLKIFKKVLWLDVDIFIQEELVDKLNANKTGIAMLQSNPEYKQIKDYVSPINDYNLNLPAYGAGQLIVEDKLPNHEILTDWCYEKTEKYAECLKNGDQAIINLAIQEFGLEVEELKFDKYACQPVNKKGLKNAFIVHPAGRYKFWNYSVYYNQFNEWKKNYKAWLKMSGTPFMGTKFNLFSNYFLTLFPQAPDPSRHTKKFLIYCFNQLKERIHSGS